MALDVMEMLLKYPSSLRDSSVFERASKMAHWVDGWNDRRRAAKTAGVIISPAGMLKGGAAVYYMKTAFCFFAATFSMYKTDAQAFHIPARDIITPTLLPPIF